ncbi:MAG: NAD(P)-binding domain-containing protein [Bdellovibrionales bacterium]|nr:NAD(P)-binding domain-containing protein [Bdellovibrionales bacterium]
MKIGILGSGIVGETLANGFIKHGHNVMRGSRTPDKLNEWATKNGGKTGTFKEAAKFGDVVVLAVKGTAAESAVSLCESEMDNKTVLDATNPISDQSPQNGVLNFFTGINDSLMERLQKKASKAHFVKCFSCVGNPFMVNPSFSLKPTMFICGNNDHAKSIALEILTQFGWETEDMGAVEAARAIEPLCMLWCIPGMIRNQWSHAFKLLKV